MAEHLRVVKTAITVPRKGANRNRKGKKRYDRSGVDAYFIRRTLIACLWGVDVDLDECAFVAALGFTEDWNQIEDFGAGSAVIVFESNGCEHGVLFY